MKKIVGLILLSVMSCSLVVPDKKRIDAKKTLVRLGRELTRTLESETDKFHINSKKLFRSYVFKKAAINLPKGIRTKLKELEYEVENSLSAIGTVNSIYASGLPIIRF
jgi:hypothetical protein